MKTQNQWLFELPFVPEFTSEKQSGSYVSRENEWEVYETSKPSRLQLQFRKNPKPMKFKDSRAQQEQDFLLTKKLPLGVAGYAYECLVRTQFNFKVGIPHGDLIPDAGTNIEITLEGSKNPFGTHKQNQFRRYLKSSKGSLVLFLPHLSADAEAQLRKIGEAEQEEVNKRKQNKQLKIWIYETK